MSQRLKCVAVLVWLIAAVDLSAAYSKSHDFRAATPAELAMKGVDSAPGAAAAILDWVRYDDDTASLSSEYVRIKVFTDEGKKYGDVELPYYASHPYLARITDIEARTIRPDGEAVRFNGKVYDKVLYKAGGMALRAKTFSLTDVQAGSILEYRFTRRWSELMLLNTTWDLQYDIPLLHAKLTLRPYDSRGEYSSFFTYMGLPAGTLPVKMSDRYELELANMPPYQAESFAPPERLLKAYVNFYYTSSRLRPDEFWNVEARIWSKKIEEFLSRANGAKTIAAQLASPDPRETAKKVYAHVQKMRNYSFEWNDTEQNGPAKNVDEVLRNGGGFGEELNRAFVALARAAGLQANAVRVAPRDTSFFSDKLPDATQMSGEVAVVTIDGKPLYLDPGTPHAPFGTVSWEKAFVTGFRVSKGAPAEWVQLPSLAPEAALIKRSADLKISGETLEGTVVATFSGQEALVRRLRNLGEDDETRNENFEKEMSGWFGDRARVKLAKLSGVASFDEPLVATFEVSLPNVVSSAGTRAIVPLSIFGANASNPFTASTRVHPIYFPYPRSEEDEVKLTLPESMTVSAVPPPATLGVGTFRYSSESTPGENSVTLKRSAVFAATLVDMKYYGSLRNFYSSMIAADQKPLVLVARE